MVRSFYDLLQVDQHATLEEIKLAFKKRALHVHPDKGGSKEAFHLVYHAFETLADPEARRKYDVRAAKRNQATFCHGSVADRRQPFAARKSASTSSGTTYTARQLASALSHEAKLLVRIRDLLRSLPRDVRNDVIRQDFSQKQRLILEKWMVDVSDTPSAETQPVTEATATGPTGDPPNSSLALSAGSPKPRAKISKTAGRQKSEWKTSSSKKRQRRTGGAINKTTLFGTCVSYIPRICFDGIELRTGGNCDLQTALEYLVVLTTVKQKMQESTRSDTRFEERLQAALLASATEHGRDVEQLKLRFGVYQPAGFFLGPRFVLHSPTVRSIEEVGKLRKLMSPFRQYFRNRGRSSMFWWYSPEHLQEAWEHFQRAIADMWQAAGVDPEDILRRIRACYGAHASMRERHLQFWESQHMTLQDKIKHRPKRLQSHYYVPPNERRDFDEALSAVRQHLHRWGLLLERKAQLLEKERHKAAQKRRKAQRERLEELMRKREQEEKLTWMSEGGLFYITLSRLT